MVFLSTTGDVLNATQQTAFENYVNGGGGYVGVHAAADTEYDWAYYGNLVGAWFQSHPAIQTADGPHRGPGPRGHGPPGRDLVPVGRVVLLPHQPQEQREDPAEPRRGQLLGRRDGRPSRSPGARTSSNGRSFYTGLGHTQATYSEAAFRTLLLGGIRYAAGWAKQDCRVETGYTPIYNGSTTGWSQAGPGSFTQHRRHR